MENNNDIYHHGIIGQKWGIRRYQNKDGSLTPAGKRRAAKLESEYQKLTKQPIKETKSKKTIREMSDVELREKVNRARLEKDYRSLYPEKVTIGQKIAKTLLNDVIAPAAVNAGKDLVTQYMKNLGNTLIKNNDDKNKK